MTPEEIKHNIEQHRLWLIGEGGFRADLQSADLHYADLHGANLRYADLHGANLRYADLRYANLYGADLHGANLRYADLHGANLHGAVLLCAGDMKYLRTMQIDKWIIGYTHDTLQIGCQRHFIGKWAKWETDAGRKWISQMDGGALEWADRNMNLVLALIAANPAWTPEVQ